MFFSTFCLDLFKVCFYFGHCTNKSSFSLFYQLFGIVCREWKTTSIIYLIGCIIPGFFKSFSHSTDNIILAIFSHFSNFSLIQKSIFSYIIDKTWIIIENYLIFFRLQVSHLDSFVCKLRQDYGPSSLVKHNYRHIQHYFIDRAQVLM